MTRLTVMTPTYRPDFGTFRDLHDSVLRFTDESVVHHAIVPARDVGLFSTIRSSRLAVVATDEFLPRRYVSTYGPARAIRGIPGMSWFPPVQSVNLRRPWPPVRGWILQQVVKLAAASCLDADVVLTVDSDVCFIQRITAGTFRRAGTTRLYRGVGAVHAGMPDHIRWHATARRLLGLSPSGPSVRNDYIAPMVALDPVLIRGLRDRVEMVGGRGWIDTLTAELRFSEYILYGTYVDELAPPSARTFADGASLCHSRWGAKPLDAAEADRFLESLSEHDVALHVQSTSRTDAVVRHAIAQAATRAPSQ